MYPFVLCFHNFSACWPDLLSPLLACKSWSQSPTASMRIGNQRENKPGFGAAAKGKVGHLWPKGKKKNETTEVNQQVHSSKLISTQLWISNTGDYIKIIEEIKKWEEGGWEKWMLLSQRDTRCKPVANQDFSVPQIWVCVIPWNCCTWTRWQRSQLYLGMWAGLQETPAPQVGSDQPLVPPVHLSLCLLIISVHEVKQEALYRRL